LQTKQVAVVPDPTMIAAAFEQTQPTLGDQTNRELIQLQVVEEREATAYIVELQVTQL
jgi:hypothetical protein